ncbi:hypothetical protein GIB67_017108 [Kingdonia uniflora]|uniref:UGP3-like C-terminal hexapeptide repeats domain-containing protein n=1 Tax=Kingdonia uniflora TaxID=39325 RepID=A0A7J7NCL8_9MAGN|nr:hypothetical protein GIB67_017108 [Kingdonia uniflora]
MARITPILHHYHHPNLLSSLPPPHSLPLIFSNNARNLHLPKHHLHSLSSLISPRVSTTSVEYEPIPDFNLQNELQRLQILQSKLSKLKNSSSRLRVIESDSRVKEFFSNRNFGFVRVLSDLNLDVNEVFLLKCLVAAGQEHVLDFEGLEIEARSMSSVRSALFALAETIENWDLSNGSSSSSGSSGKEKKRRERIVEPVKQLLKTLGEIEKFYDCIGGIIGYQIMVLELLIPSKSRNQSKNIVTLLDESMKSQIVEIHVPKGLDLSNNTEYASQAALWGIEGLPQLGEIYPLGGSGDRLGLVDPDTGDSLPAAMLPYCGRTLLEGLIRDLQPLVPTVGAEDGQWLVGKPFVPVCKPGGHGVIWKLAYDKGIFKWFYEHGRKGATVRQISNVVAATDLTLLALAGIGLRQGKKLGFASCKRKFGATEGINVLIEKNNLDEKWAYGLSCIEYTEFDKFGVRDGPIYPHSLLTEFPANTNILYVDLNLAEKVGSRKDATCLPGMVLNLKKPIVYVDHLEIRHSVPGGRLECTMQNIADNFLNTYSSRCYSGVEDSLDTFVVYNERKRVTSSAKRRKVHTDRSMRQTPDGSLLDIIRNASDLLSLCEIKIPKIEDNENYFNSGPPFLILLHPALGPLWEVTRQKFNGGSISKGSELQIEVSEFLWRNVQLDGSLIIVANNIMGSTRMDENGEPIMQYGQRCGRCKLQNVKVFNKGIDWRSSENIYWKHAVRRFESVKVKLHGNAEFEATNVVLEGNHTFEVPDGHKLLVTAGSSGLSVKLEEIERERMDRGSWFWKYKLNGSHINLEIAES